MIVEYYARLLCAFQSPLHNLLLHVRGDCTVWDLVAKKYLIPGLDHLRYLRSYLHLKQTFGLAYLHNVLASDLCLHQVIGAADM